MGKNELATMSLSTLAPWMVAAYSGAMLFFGIVESAYGYGYFSELSVSSYLITFAINVAIPVIAFLVTLMEWKRISSDTDIDPSHAWRLLKTHFLVVVGTGAQMLLFFLYYNHTNNTSPVRNVIDTNLLMWRAMFTITFGCSLHHLTLELSALLEWYIAIDAEEETGPSPPNATMIAMSTTGSAPPVNVPAVTPYSTISYTPPVALPVSATPTYLSTGSRFNPALRKHLLSK